MKKVKIIFLSSIFMYSNNYSTKNKRSTIQIDSLKTDDISEIESISSSNYPYGNSSSNTSTKSNADSYSAISFQTEQQASAPSDTNSEINSINSSNISRTKTTTAPHSNKTVSQIKTSTPSRTYSEISAKNKLNKTVSNVNSSILSNQSKHTVPCSFKEKFNSQTTTIGLNQLSSQDFNKYVQSQMNMNKINILESLNESYASSSNIYENFMINIQKTKLYSIAKNFNINIEEHIQNIPKISIQIDFKTELNTYEDILNAIFNLIEQNLSDVTNFKQMHSQLDESIKCLQETIKTSNKKDITTISLIKSIIELLQNIKKNTECFSKSIKDDLDKIRVCYKIDFFNAIISSTKDDFKEDLLKEHIREIWENYRFKYFEKHPHQLNVLSKKSNKDISIKDFNNIPIDFQEDLNAMINYAKNTTEKMEAVISLMQPLSNLANLSDSLLNNTNSLEFLTKLQYSFENMNNMVQKIQINNALPNITSSINNLYTTLNDSLTLLLIETVKNAENLHNKNNAGFFNTFKRTYVPFTISGLASLRNVLMFNHFKIHSNDIVDKYALSAHDWYSSNYRIPNILNTMSTDNKNSIVKALELQKSILLKLIETFNHNYQNKTLLTKKDYKHISKLVSQLQIIMNILTALKPSTENTNSSAKILEDLKFNLHSVSEDLNYIKRNSYQPNESFFVSKKTKESESIQILTSETNNKQLRYLTKLLYDFFYNSKKLTKVSEEDPQDLKDNNLFDLKTNHTEFLNKK